MARVTNTDVAEKLDVLLAEMSALRAEVAALRAALAAGRSAPRRVDPAAAAGGGAPAAEEEPEVPPVTLDVDPATPEELLEELFVAATDEDDERGFERFLLLMHPRSLDGPRARSSLKAFQWKQLRKNVAEYLEDIERLDSFRITDQRPQPLRPSDAICKVFIASNRRMPVPVVLRRLDADPSRWRVEVCSL